MYWIWECELLKIACSFHFLHFPLPLFTLHFSHFTSPSPLLPLHSANLALDTLAWTLFFRFTTVKGIKTQTMTSTPSSVRTATRQLLLGGEFSDMDIICQGVIFKAHKAIVCTQSEYFRKAFFGYFKVRKPPSLFMSISLTDIRRNRSIKPSLSRMRHQKQSNVFCPFSISENIAGMGTFSPSRATPIPIRSWQMRRSQRIKPMLLKFRRTSLLITSESTSQQINTSSILWSPLSQPSSQNGQRKTGNHRYSLKSLKKSLLHSHLMIQVFKKSLQRFTQLI